MATKATTRTGSRSTTLNLSPESNSLRSTRRSIINSVALTTAIGVWHKPLIDSICLPAHAQASPVRSQWNATVSITSAFSRLDSAPVPIDPPIIRTRTLNVSDEELNAGVFYRTEDYIDITYEITHRDDDTISGNYSESEDLNFLLGTWTARRQ